MGSSCQSFSSLFHPSFANVVLSYVEIEIQSISTLPTTKYKPSPKKKKKKTTKCKH